jgi:hypothetical protein
MSTPRVLVLVAAMSVVVAIASGMTGLGGSSLAGSAAAIAGSALLAAAHVSALARRRAAWLMVLGLLCNAGALILALAVALRRSSRWSGIDLADPALALAGVAVSAAVIGATLMQPANNRAQRLIRTLTVSIAGCVTCVWLVNLIVDHPVAQRLAAALALVVIAGLLINLFGGRLRQLLGGQGPSVTLLCPRCQRRQSLRSGGDACAGCGLRIKVYVP